MNVASRGEVSDSSKLGNDIGIDDGNGGARKLYESRGFVLRDSRLIVPFPDSKQDGSNWLLMVKE